MRNFILSLILLSYILCSNNISAQTKVDDIYSKSETQSVTVDKKAVKSTDTNYLLLGGVAIHPSQTSGFLMIGAVKTIGGYLKFKTNFNFDENFYVDGLSTANRYFSSDVQTGRYALTGGLLWQLAPPIIMYGGLGYGSRWVNWKTVSDDIYRVNDISHKGLELETGLMLKINKLVLSGGVSVTSFNYMEANIGVGIMFGIPKPKIKATHVKTAHGGRK